MSKDVTNQMIDLINKFFFNYLPMILLLFIICLIFLLTGCEELSNQNKDYNEDQLIENVKLINEKLECKAPEQLTEQNNNLIQSNNKLLDKVEVCLNENSKLQSQNTYLSQELTRVNKTTCNTCLKQLNNCDKRLEECYINDTAATLIVQNQTLIDIANNATKSLKNCTDKLISINQSLWG